MRYAVDMENLRFGSIDCARYILRKAKERGVELNATQLLKYLYVFDGLMLASGYNAVDENARAWEYGPVYPNVYRWFISSGRKDDIDPSVLSRFREFSIIDAVCDVIFNVFKGWTAKELSAWSHQPNSPWDNALNKHKAYNCIIDKSDIAVYFKDMLSAKA